MINEPAVYINWLAGALRGGSLLHVLVISWRQFPNAVTLSYFIVPDHFTPRNDVKTSLTRTYNTR